MALIHKRRARSFLTRGSVSNVGYHPRGVGGMSDNAPTVSFTVGEHSVYLSVPEYKTLVGELNKLLEENRGV